jgi:TetR/AcrR family transcriptional regulator, repressor of fatR-cypB operon
MNVHSVNSKPKKRRPGRPNSSDDRKREAILQAAWQVFAAMGVHGASIPPVAEAAGVGVGTLYRYFKNKEDLVNVAFRTAKRRLEAALLPALEAALPPRERFTAFWEELTAFSIEERDAFHFLEMHDHGDYLDKESQAVELAVLAPIWAMCVDFQKRGIFDSHVRPEVAMALVWGAFVGLVKAKRYKRARIGEADFEQAGEACWRALCKK